MNKADKKALCCCLQKVRKSGIIEVDIPGNVAYRFPYASPEKTSTYIFLWAAIRLFKKQCDSKKISDMNLITTVGVSKTVRLLAEML